MTLEEISKLIKEARAADVLGDEAAVANIQVAIGDVAPSLRQLWDFDKVFLDEGLGDRPSELVAQRILDTFDSSQIQPEEPMTKPIKHFTACPQGQAFAQRFGEAGLYRLSKVDRAALIAALGLHLYNSTEQGEPPDIFDAALDAIPHAKDRTTDSFAEAIDILNGIDQYDTLSILQYLVQF